MECLAVFAAVQRLWKSLGGVPKKNSSVPKVRKGTLRLWYAQIFLVKSVSSELIQIHQIHTVFFWGGGTCPRCKYGTEQLDAFPFSAELFWILAVQN